MARQRGQGRVAGWYHGRSLRSRLAILASVAVALAIALCSVAAWFIVRDKLYDLPRAQLKSYAPLSPFPPRQNSDYLACGSTPAAAATQLAQINSRAQATGQARPPAGGAWNYQLLSSDGSQNCLVAGEAAKPISVHPDYLDALNLPDHQVQIRFGSYADGSPAMIRLNRTSLAVNGVPTTFVLITATPLSSVDSSLRELALLLVGVAAIGVAVAGVTGRVVARAALKPVDDLTDAVEHIARTEEVGTTIPVHGSDEIARLAGSFNSMSTALANSRDLQTRLIADAGHELRTPLTSLRTTVDLLIRSDETGRPLPPDTKTKLLGNMKAQMQELTVLIGDLLQLSRPDTPRPGQNVATVAFHEIAQRAVDRGKLRGPGLVFNVALDPWYVRADAAALERAVMNLLDNAVKYSPPGGAIDVALHEGRLTVRDHGPGIPADELKYVFDRFWRSPGSRQLPGSGLGLSIVAQTIQDSGGQVALGPAQDGGPGALAVVRLPGVPEQPETVPPVLPRD
ncbi:HAMP domain-containing sensor histidine kinase [Kitasatospora sp. NBC_01266]|uniref:HAMP domain-containing sensor histidine kinase n=1 Tax=Kitasatospora sp. NBC_01266 TaxID=2903572 RepID=UPI002E375704|nr:HAMP domain-containing sensor histidine kinase [Kitasatospora sp. NBC_01266]